MSSIDDCLRKIEAQSNPNAEEELTGQLLKDLFGDSLINHIAKCYVHIPLLRKLIAFHNAYGRSGLRKKVMGPLNMKYFRHYELHTWPGDDLEIFVEYLIELKEPLEHLPNALAENLVNAITSAIGSRSDGWRDVGYEFTQQEIMDDELRYLHDLICTLSASNYKDEPDFTEKVRKHCLKDLGNPYSRHPKEGKWNLLGVLKKGKCQTLDEVCEVASLELPHNYEPIRRLGAGRVSQVYLTNNTLTNKEIAVKIPKPEFCNPKWYPAIMKNIAELQNMSSQHVVRYYEPQIFNGRLIIFMEPFETTLEDRISEGRIPLTEAMKYFRQIAKGLLDCSHENIWSNWEGIIHPDLAPCNIGIDKKSEIKLTDFNLGIYRDREELRSQGPIDYTSPELLSESDFSIRSADNLWSLGVILYEMLTGVKPFSPPPGTIDKNTQREDYKRYMLEKQQILQKRLKTKKEGRAALDEILEGIHIISKEADDYLRYAKNEFNNHPPLQISGELRQRIPGNYLITRSKDVLREIFYKCFCHISRRMHRSKLPTKSANVLLDPYYNDILVEVLNEMYRLYPKIEKHKKDFPF